jgi:hypothetical protein
MSWAPLENRAYNHYENKSCLFYCIALYNPHKLLV